MKTTSTKTRRSTGLRRLGLAQSWQKAGGITSAALLSALLLANVLAGCGELGSLFGVEPPEATYRSLAVQNLSLETIGFDLGFDLANPNAFDLPVLQMDWNLDLFDEAFSFGQIYFEEPGATESANTSNGGVLTFLGVETIPGNGELLLNTPFSVAIPETFDGLVRVVMGEDVPFTIGGTMYFDSNFGRISLPFSQSGVIPNGDMYGFLSELGVDVIESLFD